MFHTYYEFILPLDQSAKFAIGACAGVYPLPGHSWGDCQNWYNEVLGSYQSQYGQPMPIDVWNIHAYYYVKHEVPVAEKLISDFIDPFIAWVGSVEGGEYADAEIIITEFGVYPNNLRKHQVIEYLKEITGLLEQKAESGLIHRFFWFDGGKIGGSWNDNALLDDNGNPTTLGREYAQRARDWYNKE